MRRQMRTVVLVPCAVAALLASSALAQEINATIDLGYDYGRTIDDDAVTDVRTKEFKQKYQLEVKAPLTLKFETNTKAALEVNMKSETEKAANTKATPSIETTVKSEEMEGKAGAKYTYEHNAATLTDDADTKGGWDNYVEYKFKEDRLPDLSAKYSYKKQRDTIAIGSAGPAPSTVDEIKTDKVDTEFTGTLDHDIGDLKVKFEYKDTRNRDRLPDADEKVSAEMKADGTWKRKIWDEIFDTELSYKYNDKDEKTISDTGDLEELKITTSHEAEGKVKTSMEPLPRTKVEPEYNYKYKRDVVEKTDEINQTMKAVITQGLLEWVEVKATGERKITDKKGTDKDSVKTEDTLSGELKGAYDWWLDVNGKFEYKNAVDDFVDIAAEDDYKRSISWEANWKAKWADFLDPSFSYSRKSEYEREDSVLTRTEDKAKGKFDVSFGKVLKVEPNYEWTLTDEYDVDTADLKSEKTVGDLKVKVTVDKDLSDYTNVKFSHQYGHKTETTDTPGEVTEELITIDEDTKASVVVQDIWPGFKTTAEFTRKATDKNDDDEEMKVDLTYAVKLDGAFDRWKYNSTFNYDNKGGGDADVMSFELKVDWEFNELKLGGSYKFTHTYATEEKLGKDEHKTGLTLTYKF